MDKDYTCIFSKFITMAKKIEIKKEEIILDNGNCAIASFPVIVSASRATDIPAFYSDWFFSRIEKGYSVWKNPFNGVKHYIAYRDTRFIVFWSKNPYNLIKHLNKLKEMNVNCYIQFTLNDYVEEGLEKAVPSVDYRIKIFKDLVELLGIGHVIWRFDPLVLTDKICIDDLLSKIEYIGDRLKGYTEKLVFSFADILSYGRVKKNLDNNGVNYIDWTEETMNEFALRLSKLNKMKWNYQLATCGEKIDIAKYGIEHNKCIDDNLIIKLAYEDKILMEYMGVKIIDIRNHRDLFNSFSIPEDAIKIGDGLYAIKQQRKTKATGQREFCQCIDSKDIGQYNTCPHMCEYCYANTSKELATENYKRHQTNPISESIIR